ncbi:MAG: Rieske 2Fe-2S domain-containing protein [Chloroflexi bacterium]|nr:Rieske 2Fe-2S domain-containing protein [Chloroflexota bacterium]
MPLHADLADSKEERAVVHISRSRQDRSLRDLVDWEQGHVSREIYVNEDIYQQELEQIFGRAWLFVGHESQVPNPGDFFQSRMGEESVLLVRDRKGELHVFLNTCRHRGMKVCRYDEGNSLLFTCPFHGWSYDTDGRLVGVPNFQTAYRGELDKSAWGLHEVAQMSNFYGSIWATWDPKAPSFEDFLGAFVPSLRRSFEGSDGGDNGLEFFSPVQKWRLPTNWKFPGFSFAGDHAHGAMTHRSTTVAAFGPQGELAGGDRHGVPSRWASTEYEMSIPALGHGGHGRIYEQPGVGPYVETWQTVLQADDYYHEMRDKKAEKYAGQYLHGVSGCVFPNVICGGSRILLWHPHGVGVTESWRFYTVDKGAPKPVKDAQRRYMMRYCGPGGMTESDDMENWNYAYPASLGTVARRLDYNFQNGVGHAYADDRVPGFTLNYRIGEENQRSRLRRWLDFMEAGSWDELSPAKR